MDSEIKPKADVRCVELTVEEKFLRDNGWTDEYYTKESAPYVKRILQIKGNEIDILQLKLLETKNRLTALQSAHDVEVKELKRKVLEAIPKEKEFSGADDNEHDYVNGSVDGYNEAIFDFTQSVRDAFKEEGK